MESSADGDKAFPLLSGEIFDDCERALDVASIRFQLHTLTKETLIELLASLADKEVGVWTALRDKTRMIGEDEEGWHHEVLQEKMNSPLYYVATLVSLNEYLEKGVPSNCAGSGALVGSAYDIEKVFKLYLAHCTEDRPRKIIWVAMNAAKEIWRAVISATPSPRLTQCLQASVKWEKPTLELWNRLSTSEKKTFSKRTGSIVKIGLEWKKTCGRDGMFDTWIQGMKVAADGDESLSEVFAGWDARNA